MREAENKFDKSCHQPESESTGSQPPPPPENKQGEKAQSSCDGLRGKTRQAME